MCPPDDIQYVAFLVPAFSAAGDVAFPVELLFAKETLRYLDLLLTIRMH